MMLYIPTYPDLLLQSLAHFFGPKATYVNYYWDGQWRTSQLNIVLVVNRAHAVLLCLHPSLLEVLVDCPGLDMLMLNPHHRNPEVKGKKRQQKSLL
jgi:hypothetical protein